MDVTKPKTIHYKRSHFVTQLPLDYLYSPSHAWMARQEDDLWRVGLTKFATRMLGEMVEYGFEVSPGAPVVPGQVVGWVEGFKAISDLFCIATGCFEGDNPALKAQIKLISKEPYVSGWLYLVRGTPEARCVDVHAYQRVLDKTIDKILEKQQEGEPQ